jgi:hypothetical protein
MFRSTSGVIEDGAYSHFVFLGEDETGAFWNLIYNVRHQISRSLLRIMIREADESVEITGINLVTE